MGFTYNGIHCSEQGCEYIPKENERWFASPEYSVNQDELDSRDGGYFYGSNVKIRKFEQECFYENITLQQREKIRRWIDRKTSGKLIFDERPFVSYDVRPSKCVTGKLWRHRMPNSIEDTFSGTFTITFSAYQPFGHMAYSFYTGIDMDGAKRYCDILEKNEMPPAPSAAGNYLIYNCGAEACATVITVKGTAPNGLTIENKTNGTKCTITSLPTSGSLCINGEDGSVAVVSGKTKTMNFSYHNDGFIKLDPCHFVLDEVVVSIGSQNNLIKINNGGKTFSNDEIIGKYIWIQDQWIKIIGVAADGSVVLQRGITLSGAIVTKIASMNELEIVADGATIESLIVDYVPLLL